MEWFLLREGLAHPRKALVYLLLGKKKYSEIFVYLRRHTRSTNESDLPFLKEVSKLNDMHEHLTTLYMLTVQLGLQTVVELGTDGGDSTVALLFAVRETGEGVQL